MKTLTEKQLARFDKVQSKFVRFAFRLHDETDGGFHGNTVWGVTVYDADFSNELGHVQRPKRGFQNAHTVCEPELVSSVRLALNAVSAALWHKQPNW